ncbi:3-oxoacyl-[acyl-carrier-protein] reductase FabG [Chryseobacterium nakagawai]|nr:3-oxoacyl-[acyl-carrier-protein] reductase FabG [Chryseobacterium nakagawai]
MKIEFMNHTKTWYITGASKGMGFSVVKKLLEKGYKVAATSRTLAAFEGLKDGGENFLPLEVDLKDEKSIARSIERTIEKFGQLDVVVNNAGYGLGGAIEELDGKEIEDNFQINFFAVVKVIQQVLPYLRNQRSGHIINISSIAGFAPGLGWSIYSAAKFAVTGLSEALANDLKPLGINVTAVLPGWFRTHFAKPDSIAFSQNQIKEYEFLRTAYQKMDEMDGKQLGDPDQLADAFIELIAARNPPALLFLGSDAFQRAENKMTHMAAQLKEWEHLSFSTDFKE